MAKGTLEFLVASLLAYSKTIDIYEENIWYAIRGAMNPTLLIANIAETLRIPATEAEQLLIEYGFGDLVAQNKLMDGKQTDISSSKLEYKISSNEQLPSPFPDLFSLEFSPSLNHPLLLTSAQNEAISLIVEDITQSADQDAFLNLYRKDVMDYHNKFLSTDAKLIDQYISSEFNNQYPHFIVTTGIGADELFNHYLAQINNSESTRRSTWIIVDSPRHLSRLPKDVTVENTLFMEFSRSGKTEETVKTHEYTPREAKRIVFANSGPLRDIGNRDKNLVLDLPDLVSGRFGRNKTPILLAPMHVAGMDTYSFWQEIESAINRYDFSSMDSLPLQIAQFIFLYQQINKINHIYLGCNDDLLALSADEFLQFWNEGVNKTGNDISMSRYFGLLRDSHATVEGILANNETKMGIFLLRDAVHPIQLPPITYREIDPINGNHKGMRFGDEECILAEANYLRFAELMPTIRINVYGALSARHAAILGQLWADTTFCYSRMVNVDPGSNPEVKFVRDRSASLLAEFAGR